MNAQIWETVVDGGETARDPELGSTASVEE